MAVDRRIRACTPAPGAWTTYDGERVKLGPVTHIDGQLAPGELRVGKTDVLVGTATDRGPARRRQGVRRPADAGRRLGARAPAAGHRPLRPCRARHEGE